MKNLDWFQARTLARSGTAVRRDAWRKWLTFESYVWLITQPVWLEQEYDRRVAQQWDFGAGEFLANDWTDEPWEAGRSRLIHLIRRSLPILRVRLILPVAAVAVAMAAAILRSIRLPTRPAAGEAAVVETPAAVAVAGLQAEAVVAGLNRPCRPSRRSLPSRRRTTCRRSPSR